tara:strand:+ start:32121 stop:33551 length:1431 start_codon:yes stop_codon:yes gene_type:complete
VKLQLKRSSTLENGAAKPPLATQLAYGELAVNYNATKPKVFLKDSSNTVVGLTDDYLELAGGTLTGDITLNGDPTAALMPATKQYTDNAITTLSNSISYPVTAVNSLTGNVTLNYSNVGAPSVTGTNATGMWGISVSGNSATTTSLATARNIALAGDVSGNANFDGTANISITATVADNSHDHTIANVTGLQTALNAKQDSASAASNSLQLNGKADTSFVQTTNNSSLNTDSRNSRGVTRLYRQDNDSDYSVQINFTGTRWLLQGYQANDQYHAGVEVEYAITSGTSQVTSYVSLATPDPAATHYLTFTGATTGNNLLKTDQVLQYSTSTDTLTTYNLSITNEISLPSFKIKSSSGNAGFANSSGSFLASTDTSGNFTATGDVTAFSDATLKKDIVQITDALDKVDQIRGVTFERLDFDDGTRHAGVIAQEIEKVLPEVVKEGLNGMRTVAYGNIVGLLIEAIKELRQEVKELRGE